MSDEQHMTGERRLDPSEAFHASIDWAGNYSAVCEGTVDAEALGRAFTVLSAAAPLLRGRLIRDDEGFRFEVDERPRAEFTVRGGGEAAYREEMIRRLDSSRSLARLTLVRGPGGEGSRHHVILTLHHAIADAGVGIALFARLWEIYTATVTAAPIPGAATALPTSAERLLIARGAGRADGYGPGWDDDAGAVSRALSAAAGAFELPASEVARTRLDRDTTRRLTESVSGFGLSLHGFLCGAVLVACRDELREESGPTRLVCGSPVDLRAWLSPPVGPFEATNFVAGIEFPVTVPESADPLVVARDATEGLDAAIAAIVPERVLLDSGRFSGSAVEVVDYAVSNIGRIPGLATPEGLTVTDFRGYTSTTVPGMPLFLVSVYDGRLSVELISAAGLLTADRRTRVVERLGDILRSVPGPGIAKTAGKAIRD
ncbi:hypothetical protein ABZ370_13235 [Streptomyces sp. NPDC005962]|uniref:phthiocerol/phthiodiolone dimycocerosyl transferase family protein n=1 Tax=Streptomyces sp. NPDC005962 TaxID=3154466 RepID=UPI0033E16A2A